MSPYNRTVVIETVYHNGGLGKPLTVVTRASKPCSVGQPYERVLVVKDEWYNLESGWVESPGTLVLKNDSKEHTVLVALAGKEHYLVFARISPEHSLRLEPVDVRSFFVKCDGGGLAKLTMVVLPR